MPPKYKPGGRRFPPKSSSTSGGSSSSLIPPPSSSSSSSVSSSSANVLDPEVEDQLEIELCWCIQQLETALGTGKLNERQSLDTTKTLSVLKSRTAPLIKKRQFMRTTFGDYRTKMANDMKKLGKTSAQVKFSNSNPNTNSTASSSTSNKKSIFLKKATAATTASGNDKKNHTKSPDDSITETTEKFSIKPTGNTFTFNFADPEK